MRQGNKIFLYICGSAVACLLLCCVLLVGRAQAHFESKKDFQVSVSPQELHNIYVQPISSRSSVDWQNKVFVLSNYQKGDIAADKPAMTAKVAVLATVGLENPDKLKVTLKKDGQSYAGIAEQVCEGTELYRTFGPGWKYSFYNAQGEEIPFLFPENNQKEIEFEICVQGLQNVNFDSLLRVRAVGTVDQKVR